MLPARCTRNNVYIPYMWVILCLVGYKLVGERLAAFARARKRSDVTRGHMWATFTTFTTCSASGVWVILCPRRKHHTLGNVGNVGERLASPARARKRSDVTRGHMWARRVLAQRVKQGPLLGKESAKTTYWLLKELNLGVRRFTA